MGRAINESERRFDGSGIGKVRWDDLRLGTWLFARWYGSLVITSPCAAGDMGDVSRHSKRIGSG